MRDMKITVRAEVPDAEPEGARDALVGMMEFVFGLRPGIGGEMISAFEDWRAGVTLEGMTIEVNPREGEAAEWRRVALEKWRHYRDNVWPSGKEFAQRFHAHSLAKLIPYLLGMPEEALQETPDPHHNEERISAYPLGSLEFEQELPGLWERADYEGGQDETRPRSDG